MATRKLTTDDLMKIIGGTREDAAQYLKELYAKYGIPEGDTASLIEVLTDEDLDKLREYLHK